MPKGPKDAEHLVLEYHRGHSVRFIDVTLGRVDDTRTACRGKHGSTLSRLAGLLRAAFLPEGFPESVSSDYLGNLVATASCWRCSPTL